MGQHHNYWRHCYPCLRTQVLNNLLHSKRFLSMLLFTKTKGEQILFLCKRWHVTYLANCIYFPGLKHKTEVQGWAKVRFPGSVNMWWKSCVLLPAAGKRTQLFHLIFTEPGTHTLAHPCTCPSLSLETQPKTEREGKQRRKEIAIAVFSFLADLDQREIPVATFSHCRRGS